MADDVETMSVAGLVDAVGGPGKAAELVSRLWAGDPRYAMAMDCEPRLQPKVTGKGLKGAHIDVIIIDDVECVELQPKVTSNEGFLHLDLLIIDEDEWLQNGGATPSPVAVRTITFKAWYQAAVVATAGEFDWVTIEGGGAITIRQFSDIGEPPYGGATVELGGLTRDTLQIRWVDAPGPPREFDEFATWIESLREFEARVKKIRAAMRKAFGGPAVITEWTVK